MYIQDVYYLRNMYIYIHIYIYSNINYDLGKNFINYENDEYNNNITVMILIIYDVIIKYIWCHV